MKHLKYFEDFSFGKTFTEEEREFLDRIKKYLPEDYTKYINVIRRKGLNYAIEEYLNYGKGKVVEILDRDFFKKKEKEKNDKERIIKRKKQSLGGAKDELRTLLPNKKAIEDLFRKYFITNELNALYHALGVVLPIAFTSTPSIRKYDADLKFNGKSTDVFTKRTNPKLEDIVRLLDRINGKKQLKPDQNWIKHGIGNIKTFLPEVDIKKEVEFGLTLQIGDWEGYKCSLSFSIGYDFHNWEYPTETFEKENGIEPELLYSFISKEHEFKIPKFLDENTNILDSYVKVFELTEDTFKKLSDDVIVKANEALAKSEVIEKFFIRQVINAINNNLDKFEFIISTIETYYPNAYKKIFDPKLFLSAIKKRKDAPVILRYIYQKNPELFAELEKVAKKGELKLMIKFAGNRNNNI